MITKFHLSFEHDKATLGGLGVVTTQMLQAERRSLLSPPSVITPYYSAIFKDSVKADRHYKINHIYNYAEISSTVHLINRNGISHYMIEAEGKYCYMFAGNNCESIYEDTANNRLIERILFFCSAAAAFINTQPSCVLFIHEWHMALTTMLLHKIYRNIRSKSIFIAHVANADCGAINTDILKSVGINIKNSNIALKSIGLQYAHHVVAVSASFLAECLNYQHDNPLIDSVRKWFNLCRFQKNNVSVIANGIDTRDYQISTKMLADPYNIDERKRELKVKIRDNLKFISVNEPLVLFIGRFSSEKGIAKFKDLLHLSERRISFFAIGRGQCPELNVARAHYFYKTLITNDADVQLKYLAILRAAADFCFIPSLRESFGLVSVEALLHGSVIIGTDCGGLGDILKDLTLTNNGSSGNAFIYDHSDNLDASPRSFQSCVTNFITYWYTSTSAQRHSIQARLIEEAKQYDWLADNGSLDKYQKLSLSL